MICLEYMQTQCSEYLDFMGPKLQQLSIQIVHVKSITRYFVSYVDFFENYSFMESNEIQTQHWHNFQITILVHLTWRSTQISTLKMMKR